MMLQPLTLLEARVWLWPALPDGEPDTAAPIWAGQDAAPVRLAPVLQVVETRPTGAPAPRAHVLPAGHRITLGLLHLLPAADRFYYMLNAFPFVGVAATEHNDQAHP